MANDAGAAALQPGAHPDRYPVLDGWRGISILAVLAGHLLPLGPKPWLINDAVAVFGMAIFFTLSGYLITSFLLERPNVTDFLIRRLCRIVPLAWLFFVVVFVFFAATPQQIAAHFLFFGNLPPFWLLDVTGHIWSLCVEMHFYLGIALLVALFGRAGLKALPLIALAVTLARIVWQVELSIVTWFRVDEILAGACLALLHHGRNPRWARAAGLLSPYLLAVLLLVASHPQGGFMSYLRPYLAASLVGVTLWRSAGILKTLLESKGLRYVAAISFALYVFHPLLVHSWLGSGERLEKYLKRPLLFLALFALAHLSTFHFERRFIALGRRLSGRRPEPA